MNHKQGDRVRVTAANQVPGYQPGDKGTVVWEVRSTVQGKLYAVMMDKDDPQGTCPVFSAAEIEADT